jgi:hypothetical protein
VVIELSLVTAIELFLVQLQARRGARARGAMEAFGSGHQRCWTKLMDSYHHRYTLGMVMDIWIHCVDIISCRYSMDFFDGKHQVVVGYSSIFRSQNFIPTQQLGGSYATIPRISERRTFRNWYQRNYPYSWVGGRVAYDIQD